jgi:hypothetical protein
LERGRASRRRPGSRRRLGKRVGAIGISISDDILRRASPRPQRHGDRQGGGDGEGGNGVIRRARARMCFGETTRLALRSTARRAQTGSFNDDLGQRQVRGLPRYPCSQLAGTPASAALKTCSSTSPGPFQEAAAADAIAAVLALRHAGPLWQLRQRCRQADALLFQAGDPAAIDAACARSPVGKLLPDDV